jgi:acetyltransferase-like isoleucine patch superfamily enzyme
MKTADFEMKRKIFCRIYYFLYMRIIGSFLGIADKLRSHILGKLLNSRPEGLMVRAGVYISGYQNLVLGINVSLNHNCFISADGGLFIGDNVSIGHGVSILTTEHGFSDENTPIKFQPIEYHSVRIGSNCWIGAKATILAGVELAEGTIVAAGAVVAKSVKDKNTVVGGVPAKFIKNRI